MPEVLQSILEKLEGSRARFRFADGEHHLIAVISSSHVRDDGTFVGDIVGSGPQDPVYSWHLADIATIEDEYGGMLFDRAEPNQPPQPSVPATSTVSAKVDSMREPGNIVLRQIQPADLNVFYVHQLDPEGIRLAAFSPRRDRQVFDAHWTKILQASQNINRTIVAEGQVAGYVACFPLEGSLEMAYWLGREFWGRGLATEAVRQMLQVVTVRPLSAHVAAHNVGSLRVLQKCGFRITGTNRGEPGADIEEYSLRLDSVPPSTP